MGNDTASATARQTSAEDGLIVKFAQLMWESYRARVYLFGSRARGNHHPDSDYDIVAVSQAFEGQRQRLRARDRYKIWYEAGGWGIALDLHCYTPQEFRKELGGLGYLGQAKRRGEFIEFHGRAVAHRPG